MRGRSCHCGTAADCTPALQTGWTGLHNASYSGHAVVVQTLLEHGADVAARDSCGRTALLLACAHGHDAVVALLGAPTRAAGALDAIASSGFSALLWAEERGMDVVAQRLRELGAAAVRRPALALFRGEAGAVQVDVEARTVAFAGKLTEFSTFRSTQQCPRGCKGYYEIEILERDSMCPRYGFAAAAFAHVPGASYDNFRVGDDGYSWAVDGENKCTRHKGKEGRYNCYQWKEGDVVGLACDLVAMRMHVSLNGRFGASHGVVFELAPEAVCDGLFAAFTGNLGKVRYNLGEAPFLHPPPAADFQAYATFEGKP